MNNNSEQINKYLQDEMDPAEKAAFEEVLSHDAALKQELNIQRQVMKAAVNAGIKAEFAKAIHKKTIINRTMKWGLAIAASVMIFLVYNFWSTIMPSNGSFENIQVVAALKPFIDPPLSSINVPFSEYFFEAEKGATIFYGSGSIIKFPASALVDASGTPVKGRVRITYREFADPVDFFVSGIPMRYDSAGVGYNFESSGMCEINAYKDGKAVFVNKNARPEIHLSGKNKSPLHNLYFLDTANRKWNYEGKDIITEVKNTAQAKPASTAPLSFENSGMPVKPVKPAIREDDRQAFSIEIDPGSFEELFAYDKLKFQVEDESSYKRSDANEHWTNVKLEHTDVNGIYMVTFTNSARKVSYKVRPVLEGEDYEAALKVFKQKTTAYEQALQNRLVKEKNENDSISLVNKKITEKMIADNEWNIKINNLIIARNKKIRELKEGQLPDSIKAVTMNQFIELDNLIRTENEKKYAPDIYSSKEIIRSFTINNFGIWNCDQPQYQNGEIPLIANFKDNSANNISFITAAVVYGNINGISQFQTARIRVIPGGQNMIWGIKDSYFYYFTYEDFVKAKISRDTKAYTFQMRRSDKIITSYNEIRELVGAL